MDLGCWHKGNFGSSILIIVFFSMHVVLLLHKIVYDIQAAKHKNVVEGKEETSFTLLTYPLSICKSEKVFIVCLICD